MLAIAMILLALLMVVPARAEPDLTVDTAVRQALAHNPDLHAVLEEVGIAHADVVQAGIVSNPDLFAQLRFPSDRTRAGTNYELSLTQNVLDWLLRGAREGLAETQLEAARLRVSRVIFVATTAVKGSYYQVQADQLEVAYLEKLRDLCEAAAELATRQRGAGNLSELDLVRQQAMLTESRAELLRLAGQLASDRERLVRLMGSPPGADDWPLESALAEPPEHDPELQKVQELAQQKRPEVTVAQLEASVAQQGHDLAGRYWGIDGVRLGLDSEREAEGYQVTGPVLQIPLPLFDRHQGMQARYEAEQRQAEQHQQGALQDARFQARQAYRKLSTARGLVESYRDQLVPLRVHAVELAQLQYNNMNLGVYGLLGVYREELEARKMLVEALRDYWTARAELEQAVGLELKEIP